MSENYKGPTVPKPSELPPPPPCEHRFVHLDTKKKDCYGGGYQTHFVRVDRFFCEKCLEEKVIKKDEYSRDTPEWF
ncbi:beta-glucosidase [Planctomycetes bacterium TBK1r]|uniref:Uncharacterized protein n=1 Tax=Stieleria magnilauensis TaxID=2527963 RepID=A0ABX5XY47_9BACT|nr:hypothetical protein TBK1r_59750 [Planctomycetes bacterium TBK1r]QDV87026.1 hypothetical protein TBK1r_60530 [Planctomycetes bacterium TBK1r]